MSVRDLHWGRLPIPPAARRVDPAAVELPSVIGIERGPLLPRGAGRTYGDTCALSGGTLVGSARLDRILDFDAVTGLVHVEPGVTLGALLERTAPAGWIVPACPGTTHVTLGGMVAHDVHGKNHVHTGNLGGHVRALELVRSDGRVHCSRAESPELFRATIGGLGLTGFVERIELQLAPLASSAVVTERVRCRGVRAALARLEDPSTYDYGLAWVDGFTLGTGAERCVVLRARGIAEARERPPRRRGLRGAARLFGAASRVVPPALVRPSTLRLVNRLYQRGPRPLAPDVTERVEPLVDFLFPQDEAHPSSRIYGRAGVLGHHALVPAHALDALLARLAHPGDEPLLVVLKVFGDHPRAGMLTFGGPGVSVATGHRNGPRARALLDDLDAIVLAAGGRLYPAKDARMGAASFARSYPEVDEFARHVDPAFDSNFWSRVRPSPG